MSVADASDADDWLKKNKDENGILLRQDQAVEITITEEGGLSISEKVYEETLHLRKTARFFSEQSIGYSSTFTEIRDIEAYSMVPNDRGKFRKYKVEEFNTVDAESDRIFYDDQKKKTFFYPALDQGSKTVLSYTKIYKEPRLWGYYIFSSAFPVMESRYSVLVPESVKLTYKMFGIDEQQVDFCTSKKGGMVEYVWKADHLDKIRVGDGASGILHHAAHLIVYVDSYVVDGEVRRVLSDVDDLYAWYRSFIEMMETDKEDEELKSIVHDLVKNKPTELEKVESIYNWVQNNIKYIAIEDGLGGFVPRSASKVFRRRYGDCKDMSNLLKNMLEIAGIDSYLTWIGTSAIPYTHREVPTPMSDNHMICTYVRDDKYYFLDATDQFNSIGTPSSHIQGREALINRGADKYELVEVPVVPREENLITDSVYVKVNASTLSGKGRIRYKGYSRIAITYGMTNLEESDQLLFLKALLGKGHNKFAIEDYETRNLQESSEDLVIEYRFKLDDYVVDAGSEMYINPHLEKEFQDAIIDTDRQVTGKHFSYKSAQKTVLDFEIPPGYTVGYLPGNIAYENENFGFSLGYTKSERGFTVNQQTHVSVMQLGKDQFDQWNDMVRTILHAYKESVVLSKE
jgi:hypothetical protein